MVCCFCLPLYKCCSCRRGVLKCFNFRVYTLVTSHICHGALSEEGDH